jgi:hypothetical protein
MGSVQSMARKRIQSRVSQNKYIFHKAPGIYTNTIFGEIMSAAQFSANIKVKNTQHIIQFEKTN